MDKRKAILLAIILIAIGSIIFICIYNKQLIGWTISKQKVSSTVECAIHGKNASTSLSTSNNSILRKLAEYEKVCKGVVVDELMVFTSLPLNHDEAVALATETAATLKEFAGHDVRPLVLLEPNLNAQTNLIDIKQGTFDEIFKTYFNTLKTLGITDKEMGTWVLFPEANTPIWPTTNPDDFTANIVKVGRLQKDVFPTSKVSILLNSRTYQGEDKDWSHGELKSLVPYVRKIPIGIVDSFGYQGFPSLSAANAEHAYSQLEADDFLPVNFAEEAAREINIQDVWINTGSFSRIHTGSQDTEVRVSSEQRKAILQGILRQAKELKEKKFNITVNIFAEDKSLTNEHIDWSYWKSGKAAESQDTKNFSQFIHELRTEDMRFSLYDDDST